MSCQKRKADQEERGRINPSAAKRPCFQDDPVPSKTTSDQFAGKNVRVYSDEEQRRILAILEAEFDNELQAKEEEIVEIQERILKTQRILQYLCYAVVSDFYSREKTITSVASTRQRRIHPAVKKLLSGKGPPGAPEVPQNVTIPAESLLASSSTSCSSAKNIDVRDNDILNRSDSPNSCESLAGKEKKVPRYIPPKPKTKPFVGNQSEPVRGGQNKTKTILVVGNVSKWLPPDTRDDAASHKWMVYVRGPKGAPDISSFVSKVRFFLHPSYRPNDVVQVVCPPFQLSRRGWGEFPIRVQVHFSNSLNKPVDIIHNLKLDRTYSGLQTLGAETVAEVWIHREQQAEEKSIEEKSDDELQIVKREPVESVEDFSLGESETASVHSTSFETFENQGQDSQDINRKLLLQTEANSSQHRKEAVPSIPSLKRIVDSEVIVEESSECNNAAVDKIKTEPLEIISDSPVTTEAPSSETGDSKQAILEGFTGNILLSPTKTMLPETSMSSPPLVSSSIQLSPTMLLTTNTPGLSPGSQKVLCSPSKPGTQLVKCVDSKGTVRLLQVRTDLLPKILKKGTATISAPTSLVQEDGAKAIVSPTLKQVPSQPAVSRMSVQTPSTQALPHTPTTIIQLPSPVSQVTPVTKILRPMTKLPIQAPVTCVPSLAPAVQGSPLHTMSQGPTQTPVLQVPSQMTSKVALTSPIKIQGVQGMPLSPGARPVLRLVRPTGNINARPLLVANPANQQFIRLPAAASANGNRPLLVLKDGKLFMMKSALGAAAASVRTSMPVVNTVRTNSASQSVQESVTTATLKTSNISMTSSSITNQPIMSSGPQALISDVNKSTITKVSEKVSGSALNNQPSPTLNAGGVLKPRSSIVIPPAVRLSSPKPVLGVDQTMHTANKRNSQMTQHVPPPQSILNSAGIQKVAVKSGKSLLKAAVSLLKSNVGATTQSNKPAVLPARHADPLSLLKPPSLTISGMTESVSTNKRIILGRTSGSSSITATSQQALAYREILKTNVRMCPRGDEEDIWRAVRWMIKNLPIIKYEAKHPEFKILHPYCAPDEITYCSWNIGKQRACEWLRAKTARSLLKDAGWDLRNVWTTREIVLWARFHGYTPGLPLEESHKPRSPSCCDNPISSVCEYGEMTAVEEWLAAQEKTSSSSSSLSLLPEIVPPSEESDEEIDIDGISKIDPPSKVKVKLEPSSITAQYVSDEMPLEVPLHPIGHIVTKSLKSIGLHLSTEEIVPGVRYPAAHRMLIQAVQSLVEDLARRACADAWSTDISRRPRRIETSNVCSAICHRPEFDIFTCAGLGIKAISDSFISSKESKKS